MTKNSLRFFSLKMKEKILLTGGLGYIGSHLAYFLSKFYTIVIVDLICNKKIELFLAQKIGAQNIYHCNLCDSKSLKNIFEENQDIKYVLHVADLKNLTTSIKEPLAYYYNNVISLLNLLQLMERFYIRHIIFSSSAAVYSDPKTLPIFEDISLTNPTSPYGKAKKFCENILEDVSLRGNIQSLSLRFFNIVGQTIKVNTPKSGDLLTAITDTISGKQSYLKIFGNKFLTDDGYSKRDYVHIMDLVNAYKKSLSFLDKNNVNHLIFNISSGEAISTKSVIEKFEKNINKKIKCKVFPPREGEIFQIYGSNTKAKEILNWIPKFTINEIVDSLINALKYTS
ncbi:MAG: NAD-dependent epimerase/dehydratase family protein [Rickettsia sp.]|nr:NAD-dependent epimerase/dehydratase family protein [Rickettsia sp.]